ncbi:Putative STE/STE20/FRAY protein kinase [Rhizopus microsporus]|nr:Putative STE/STE20/FRAY protein kinase [Rhizopus microsporus]
MNHSVSSSSSSLSRTSSFNQIFSRRRSSTVSESTPKKMPLSRQRSISEIMSRVTRLSIRTHSTNTPCQQTYSSKVGDYDILRTIGAGATASVYSAIYKPTQSMIAIKTVNLEDNHLDDSRLEALRKEIQIMNLCKHPHLLQVYQSFVHSSQLYIVTPIMSAGSCHDILLKNRCVGLKENIVSW